MASTSTTLIRDTVGNVATYLAEQLSSSGISEQEFENLLTTYVVQNQTDDLPASSIVPDFEANKAELTTLLLSTKNPSWTIQFIASTGAQLLQMIATAQTLNQLGFELALREAFIQLAQLQSSIYASTIDMGVRVARKSPASCTVALTTTQDSEYLPAYSQFSIGGTDFFSRDTISLASGTTTTATLYQGTVETETFTSDGSALQSFQFGNSDYAISNDDISVVVGGSLWTRTPYTLFYAVGLWEYGSSDTVFTEGTTADGNAVIFFGNGDEGQIPSASAIISVQYSTTLGTDGNVAVINQTVSASSSTTVSGTATSDATNGFDERDPEDYKILSPGMYAAKLKPSSDSDYSVFALNYPGVIDALFQGQQIFAPDDTTMCMKVKGCLLVGSTWTADDTTAFNAWLTGSNGGVKYAGANLQFLLSTATAISANPVITVYCYNTANYSTVKTNITAAIQKLFTPKAGYLGRGITDSDLSRAIDKTEQSDIDYYDIDMDDIWPTATQYVVLSSLTINVVGTSRRSS